MHRLALLLALACAPAPAAAQLVASDTLRPPPNTETLDLRVFRALYGIEQPVFAAVMRQANAASRSVFIGAVPAAAVAALAAGEEWRPVARLALTEAAGIGATYALKGALRRPRPCAALEGVASRAGTCPDFDRFSFPSGHAMLSFGLATSAALSYPAWYVSVPALSWATATALARVWHGVHYPTDIAAGAALGAGAAVLVHLLLPSGDGDVGPALVAFRLSL